MGGDEVAEGRKYESRINLVRSGDPNLSDIKRREKALGFSSDGKHTTGMLEEHFSLRSKRDFLMKPSEQREAETFLKFGDVLADCRLGHTQNISSFCKTAFLCYSNEDLESEIFEHSHDLCVSANIQNDFLIIFVD